VKGVQALQGWWEDLKIMSWKKAPGKEMTEIGAKGWVVLVGGFFWVGFGGGGGGVWGVFVGGFFFCFGWGCRGGREPGDHAV